jgi:thioredoxin-like negative regulator of GroEL
MRKFSALLLSLLFLGGCASNSPVPVEEPSGPSAAELAAEARTKQAGAVLEQALSQIEIGSPTSLQNALIMIEANESAKTSEQGRALEAVAITLLEKVYPALKLNLPTPNPPIINTYALILQDASRGVFRTPTVQTNDCLELILPFLAYIDGATAEQYRVALPYLEQARTINSQSCLAPYFLGLAYQAYGFPDDAEEAFRYSWTRGSQCYPAACALTLLLAENGNYNEAVSLMGEVRNVYPDNETVLRCAAKLYYDAEDWPNVISTTQAVLAINGQDTTFLLMLSRAALETGAYSTAKDALTRYARYGAQDTADYLFLHARYQAESGAIQDGKAQALAQMRKLMAAYPDDLTYKQYAAQLLFASSSAADNEEGRSLYKELIADANANTDANANAGETLPPVLLIAALRDAVSRQQWADAREAISRIPEDQRTVEVLLMGAKAERSLDDHDQALNYARAAYQAQPRNDDAILSYVTSLIDTGNDLEAGRLISSRLDALPSGTVRGAYYYQRSRLQVVTDLQVADLQSCRYEDPRNIDALIGLADYYLSRGEASRADHFITQAELIDPTDPRLANYR